MVKRTLIKSSEKAKLAAYICLCQPHVEYAAAVRDPNLEMVQNNAVGFISKLKSRDSITSALVCLDLETLAARHGKAGHSLLNKSWANKENHNLLNNAYEDLMNN